MLCLFVFSLAGASRSAAYSTQRHMGRKALECVAFLGLASVFITFVCGCWMVHKGVIYAFLRRHHNRQKTESANTLWLYDYAFISLNFFNKKSKNVISKVHCINESVVCKVLAALSLTSFSR